MVSKQEVPARSEGAAGLEGLGSEDLRSFKEVFERAERAMETNHAVFSSRVRQAQQLERQGAVTDAVVVARMAADFASTNHTGTYVSPELEELLQRAGRELHRLPQQRTGSKQRRSAGTHVLHVLSAAYDIGGHTRFVWRWIERDRNRTHSVVLTHQRNLTPPQALRDAVTRAGGQLHKLDARPSGLLERAKRLAELSRQVDVVVLHTHPFDVIPLLAFAGDSSDPGVPVVLLNQADHVFWLSRNVSRLVVNFRHSGSTFSASRRGVPPANTALLPIPLQPPPRTLTRGEAKARLGLSEKEKVIFSVASAYKYTALGALDFARIISSFACERDVTVLVVGPERNARWARAEAASGGRVRALGRRADLTLFHQAADIYLDSVPFGSATSLLEAGSYEVPVLSLNPFAGAGVMMLDDPALAHADIMRTSVRSYRERLSELLENDQARTQAGCETASRIAHTHAGEGWLAQLEAMYARAFGAPPMPRLEHAVRAADMPDLLLTSLNLLAGKARTPEQVFTEHMQLLPLGSRLKQVLGSPGRERPGRLLSDWLGQQYELYAGKGHQSVSG